ncbi:MAG: hypothetical protein IKL89_01320 [Clostridia bacterium]|nr:hypothetical protein [Clostridia bacterium]
MKFNKKKVFVSALAISLVAIISMGSIAWFTAQDSVENRFNVADSETTPADKLFSVTVYEQRDTNFDGDFNEAGDVEYTEDGLSYSAFLPGDTLSKIAHVKNTGSYNQYMRAVITVSDADKWIAALGADFVIEDILEGYDASLWARIDRIGNGTANTLTYVLYYDGIVAPGQDITVFTGVEIPSELTQADYVAFGKDFTVNVKAQAVQTENVGADAYAAFTTVGMAL